MERLPFVLRFGQETAQKPLSDAERETLLQTLAAAGAENFSIWQIEDFWFCYGEYSELRGAEAAAQALCAVAGAELFSPLGADLAVDQHLPLLNEEFGFAAGGGDGRQLQKVLELDILRGNGNHFHIYHAFSRTGSTI